MQKNNKDFFLPFLSSSVFTFHLAGASPRTVAIHLHLIQSYFLKLDLLCDEMEEEREWWNGNESKESLTFWQFKRSEK